MWASLSSQITWRGKEVCVHNFQSQPRACGGMVDAVVCWSLLARGAEPTTQGGQSGVTVVRMENNTSNK